MSRKDELIASAEAARLEARRDPSPAARQAAIEASASLSAWIMENDPPKRGSYSNRAGKRQAAERRAVYRHR